MRSSTLLAALTSLPNVLAAPSQNYNPLDVRDLPITRSGSELRLNGQPWTASGANVYWLGLDENVIPPKGQPFYAPFNASYPTKGRITEVMNVLNTMGAHLIRSQTVGVSVGNPLSVHPSLNTFNEQAFDTIDWTVYQAREHGLRIMAPLVDNYNYYHGGKYDFLAFRGIIIDSSQGYSNVDPRIMEFYNNRTIVNDFKNYIFHLLTHRNQYTGLTYAEDPTIAIYETGNELGGPTFGDMDVPNAWTQEIASYVKSLAPHKLVVDGTYGVNKTHFAVQEVDIFSDHFYPPEVSKLQADIALVKTSNRAYLAGEYDWTGKNGGDSLQAFYSVVEAAQKEAQPVVVGDLFWSLFEHNVPNCQQFVNHTDGYTLQYGNPANSAQVNGQISAIRQHFFKMQGETVSTALPGVQCPGPLYSTYSGTGH